LCQGNNSEPATHNNGNNIADTFQTGHPFGIVPANGLE
jgi:hypothetical protein